MGLPWGCQSGTERTRTEIAKRADYIDLVWTKGIRAIGGFTSSATYGIGDAVDWLGPNP